MLAHFSTYFLEIACYFKTYWKPWKCQFRKFEHFHFSSDFNSLINLKANKGNDLFYFVGVAWILKYHNLFWKIYIILVFLYFHMKCSAYMFFNLLMWFGFHLRRKLLWMRYRHCFSSYSNNDKGVNNDKSLWFCQFLCYHTLYNPYLLCTLIMEDTLVYMSTRNMDVFDIWSWPHFHGLLTLLDVGQFCVLVSFSHLL